MKKDKQKTKVTFYKDSKNSKEIFAYFPLEFWDNAKKFRTCYSHIGQHSACSPEYIKQKSIKKASKTEFQDLFNELESIGYNLEVTNK